jgi:hypothetical protein
MGCKRFRGLESATNILDHNIVWTFEDGIGEASTKALLDGVCSCSKKVSSPCGGRIIVVDLMLASRQHNGRGERRFPGPMLPDRWRLAKGC